MKTKICAVLLGLVVVVSSGTAAEACTRKTPGKAASTIVPQNKINQNMLDSAVRAEVNFHRCRAGLPSVSNAGGGLAKQAKGHSNWMAKSQQLTHRSTVAGRASLQQRIKQSGIKKVRKGSENIGVVHRYQIDGRRFKIANSGACQFSTYEGQALGAHSYASLARHIVALWMDSPGHRKNILDRKVSKVSTAVAFDPNAQYCGKFWLTQNFVG